MENTSENKKNEWKKKQPSAHLTLGILAHVDSEKPPCPRHSLPDRAIRKLGRVDHQDAFLDTYELEKARGITIFSKQAEFTLGEKAVTIWIRRGTWIFRRRWNGTLQVLDYAVLVISALDGVRGQVRVLWKLLRRYEVPVFLFINKMESAGSRSGADSGAAAEGAGQPLSGFRAGFVCGRTAGKSGHVRGRAAGILLEERL